MALSLDGSNQANVAAATSVAAALTTSNTNDLICAKRSF